MGIFATEVPDFGTMSDQPFLRKAQQRFANGGAADPVFQSDLFLTDRFSGETLH